MHYYQFNIGDYKKNTYHLSLIEDGIYRRLLDKAFDTEKPLDKDIDILCRVLCLSDYKTETQAILNEFFKLDKNGWVNKRVKRELAEYSAKATTARSNGKLGGRPKITQSVNSGLAKQTQPKAKQEPLNTKHKTINNKQETVKKNSTNVLAVIDKKKQTTYLSDDWQLPNSWGSWAMDYSNLGKPEIVLEGEKFRDYWVNITTAKGKKADWFATWRMWIRRCMDNSKNNMTFKQRDQADADASIRKQLLGEDDF